MIMTLQDLIDNEIELYDIIVKQYDDKKGYATTLFQGNWTCCPEELLCKAIGWIYPERDYATDAIYVVYEIDEWRNDR